jgi:hypothetical protein
MRKGVAIVGFLIFFFSMLVLIDGSMKLLSVGSCSSNCALAMAAKGEILYGIVFGSVGALFLAIGLIGSEKRVYGNPGN